MNVWLDGICNNCGCIVIEKGSDSPEFDYMNSCANPKCKNFKWHYNYDDEFQKYYKHFESNMWTSMWLHQTK